MTCSSETRARETIGSSNAFSPATYLANLRTLCTRTEKQNEKQNDPKRAIRLFFKSRGDPQMTEIFVSGTEVFSNAKMTETPYE